MRDLFFLTCGAISYPAFVIAPSVLKAPMAGLAMSVTVAVVVRDDGQIVLIDAGLSEEACISARRVFGLRAAFLGIRAKKGDSVLEQLRALGFDRELVSTVVATHLHFDHIGGVCDFPNAEVVCTDHELSAFRSNAQVGYRAEDLAKTGRVRTVALATDPSYGFPASVDLFGDGEIVLLDARGHTRGNIAVAIRGPRGCFVHIGDAAYQSWEYGVSPPGPSLAARMFSWNRPEMMRTYAAIRACEADPRRPVIVPSHDPVVLEKLPRTPRAS